MTSKNLVYKAACKDIEAFHKCKKPISGIRAARGTSKSTAAQVQLFVDAQAQPPCADGVRRSRMLITRVSFRDLQLSAVSTYKERFEGVPGFGDITGKEPWYAEINMSMPDGTRVESQWVFLAVPPDDLEKLGSMQFTSAYINELPDYPSVDIIASVMGSCGRYPPRDSFSPEYLNEQERRGLPAYPRRILFDANGPDSTHWLRSVEDNPPSTWAFHVQASPLLELTEAVPGAVENKGLWYIPNPKCTYSYIQPQGFKYWLDLLVGAPDHYIQSRVMGGYSDSVAGKRVYPEWAEDTVAKAPLKTEDFEGSHLIVGIDTSGLHPAACVTTVRDGTFYVLDEISATDTSFISFMEDYLVPLLSSRWSDFSMHAILDPSNPQSGINKMTAMQVVLQCGLDAELASTNYTGDRLEAVKKWLNKRNGFVIYPNCELLLAGFRGRYHYANVRGKPGIHKATPDKTTSHADAHDSLQYAALGYEVLNAGRTATPVTMKASQRRAV